MKETGLTMKWRLRFEKGGNRCVGNDADKNEKQTQRKNEQRLTLNNMLGSFVVLLAGIFSSVVVFITESILHRRESAILLPSAVKTINKVIKHQSVVVSLPGPTILKALGKFEKGIKQRKPKTIKNGNSNGDTVVKETNEPDSESSNDVINISISDRPAKNIQSESRIEDLSQDSSLKELLPVIVIIESPLKMT
jgi:hypothetical protein